MNPILKELGMPNNPTGESVRSMYQAYKAAKNPNAYINQIIRQNPIIAQIANGGNLKQTFYDMCRQRGVDPQTIINDIQR